ncbi:MAG: 3-dehydroquinate synthase [Oscillospiraceae bacterium]|nr:3-dehydroquinate synthase [Oscillospiraceae bacterium]
MLSLSVTAGDAVYDIHISPGVWEASAEALARWRGRRAAVVADSNTAPLFRPRMAAALTASGITPTLLTVPAGEASKCHAQLLSLYTGFLDMALTRADLVVALGGGVVGDLAGYAAATYLRGVPLLQAPTTLLAQVDSSVGGKVAVNLPQGKNLVGAFCQPALVLIDPDTLRTLDARQLGAGLGEVIKYGCIADAALFAQLEAAGSRAALASMLPDIVCRCCRIKAGYVARDPLDFGPRMELNFGHTLGHALENALGYGALLHGEAVCLGMLAAARWGEAAGVTPPGTSARIRALLTALGLPTDAPPVPPEALARAAKLDKKAAGDTVQLVLLSGIGRAVLRPTSRAQLAAWLREEARACG